MKLALFGGSFDPIHHGHLILAREAMERLQIDRVIFIPAAQSPHKPGLRPASAEVRLAMLRGAIEGEPGFEIDEWELKRPAPSYSIDTVKEYRRRHPAAELFWFLGEDNRHDLETWHEIDLLRSLVEFVWLGRRNGAAESDAYPLRIDISSSEIRKRVALGLSIRYLLPEHACKLIQHHRLYRPS